MNNLFVYSCSNGKFGSSYQGNLIGFTDNFCWGQIISERLGYNLKNRALPGASNFHIFSRVKHDIEFDKHNENDIVIVLWSYINRGYCLVDDKSVMPCHEDEESKTYYKFFYNEMQNLTALYGYNQLVKNNIKAKYYYGFGDDMQDLRNADSFIFSLLQNNDKQYLQKNGKNLVELLRGDSRNFFPCNHANRLGHLKLANVILELIENDLSITK